MASPTQEYNAYQVAYDHFKKELFDEDLPPCLITFQRHRRACGYFYHMALQTEKIRLCVLTKSHLIRIHLWAAQTKRF